MAWITATIYTRGGTCKYNTLYYHTAYPYEWFEDPNNTSAGSISYVYPKPSKPGCTFLGGTTGSSGTGYTIIGSGGLLFSPPTDSSTINVYLQWEGCPSATISLTNLSGGSSTIIYNPETGNLYADASMTTPLTATTVQEGGQTFVAWGPIVPPSKECYAFRGYWSASNNTGTLYIDAQGYVRQALVDALSGMTANDTLTLYAKGEEVSKKLTLSVNGGSGGLSAIYNSLAERSKWYANSLCEGEPITSVPIPGKITAANVGYVFNGYKYSSTVYIDADGTLTSSLTSLTNFTNRTATAQWQSTTKMTVNPNGGTGGDSYFYWCSSRSAYYHAVDGVLTQTAAINPPANPGYAFAGLFTAATGGTQKVAADGTISPGLTSATTLYAQWAKTAYVVSFADTTLPLFYVKVSGGGLFRDANCEEPVASGDLLWDEPPALDGHVFIGVFADNSSASTRYATATGAATADFAALTATEDVTVYCVFAELQPVSFDDDGGTGGPAPLWYLDHALYADSRGETPATFPISVPARECHAFLGYFDGSGDTKYINADGTTTQALADIVAAGISEPLDLVAQWDRLTWRVTLDEYGAVYSLAGGESGWTSDPEGTTAVTSVPVPEREGYAFLGYFTAGGVQVVDSTGGVLLFVGGDGDIALTAYWNALTVTLSFSDGSAAKSVTYDSPVGTLPAPTIPAPPGLVFEGWAVDEEIVTATTVWRWTTDMTATPKFGKPQSAGFGKVMDWFGIASSALVPLSSDSGEGRERVCCAHMGKYENGVNQTSGIWRNPSVTYAIVKNTTVALTLGRAYRATRSGNTMTVSGYMITAVEITTEVGKMPTLKVQGTANEGANAINTFPISVPVVARSKAQNLLGAISGGGNLQRVSLLATCDAVVVTENMMPCASDVVNGQIQVNGETIAPNNEAAPTAGGGFTITNTPKSTAESDYVRYTITAEKEMS